VAVTAGGLPPAYRKNLKERKWQYFAINPKKIVPCFQEIQTEESSGSVQKIETLELQGYLIS
jgi:hypothetical protein